MIKIPNNLLWRKSLAFLIDLITVITINQILIFAQVNFAGMLLVYYLISIFCYNTTFGGALLNIKIVDIQNKNLKNNFYGIIVKLSRSFITIITITALELIKNAREYEMAIQILILIALPTLFTKKRVSLIELFANSRVLPNDDNILSKKQKQKMILVKITAITLLSIYSYFAWSYPKPPMQ